MVKEFVFDASRHTIYAVAQGRITEMPSDVQVRISRKVFSGDESCPQSYRAAVEALGMKPLLFVAIGDFIRATLPPQKTPHNKTAFGMVSCMIIFEKKPAM